VNALMAWNTLGMRWLEMLAASGQVIAHRTRRNNSPAQLFGMGSEKVQATIESSNAMARQMIGFPTASPLAMWNAWAGVLASGVAPYRTRAVRNAKAGRRVR
jgi:hypothetical protein